MSFQKYFWNWNIIEDKGLGEKIGNCQTHSGKYPIYEQRVRILQSPDSLGLYRTVISSDFYSLKDDKLVQNKNEGFELIYHGKDLSKALDYFREIVANDEKTKENKVYKIFSRN